MSPSERWLLAPPESDLAILLTIARLGKCLNRHFRYIWRNQVDDTTIRAATRRLRNEGLIISARCAIRPDPPARPYPPKYVGHLHMLTKAGMEIVDLYFPQYDFNYERTMTHGKGSIIHQAAHHIGYVDVVTSILVGIADVPGLVGVMVETELDLGPYRTPRVDGYVRVRRWNDATKHSGFEPHMIPYVPWMCYYRKVINQQSDKAFAVEYDRNTEPEKTIREKAQDYERAFRSAYWMGRYPFPVPLWVVPNERRLQLVAQVWCEEYTQPFMITTEEHLQWYGANGKYSIWRTYNYGDMYHRRFITDGWYKDILEHTDVERDARLAHLRKVGQIPIAKASFFK